ncbi:MAG: hypothetical protein ABI432_06450 [Flavobacteriales bacterium]
MNATSRWITAAFLGLFALPLAAQSLGAQESLAKKWKLAYYEEAGERIPPAPDQRNDVMDLRADHTVVSIESSRTQQGTWSYDVGKKQLVVVDNDTKERMVLRVVALDPKSCVLEFKDPDGVALRMHMVPL